MAVVKEITQRQKDAQRLRKEARGVYDKVRLMLEKKHGPIIRTRGTRAFAS